MRVNCVTRLWSQNPKGWMRSGFVILGSFCVAAVELL